MNRDRSGLFYHMALIGEQTQRCDNGDQRDADAIFRVCCRFTTAQPNYGAPTDENGRNGDQNHLHQRRKSLCLAMPEPVIIVGGHRGVADTEQCQQRCQYVEAGIGKRAEQRDRAGFCRRIDFQRKQEQRHADAGNCGARGQAAVRFVMMVVGQTQFTSPFALSLSNSKGAQTCFDKVSTNGK